MPCARSRSSSRAVSVSAATASNIETSSSLLSLAAPARATRRSYESASSRCWAPAWRSRSSWRRAASAVSTMRPRDVWSAWSCASASARNASFSTESLAADPSARPSSGSFTSAGSWSTSASGLSPRAILATARSAAGGSAACPSASMSSPEPRRGYRTSTPGSPSPAASVSRSCPGRGASPRSSARRVRRARVRDTRRTVQARPSASIVYETDRATKIAANPVRSGSSSGVRKRVIAYVASDAPTRSAGPMTGSMARRPGPVAPISRRQPNAIRPNAMASADHSIT